MESALKGAGEVETLQAASIDAQLDANPWLRFLFEVYPVGFKGHPARELYLGYVSWCKDQGMKGVISNTKFGRKLQRLEQYNSTLHKRSTQRCTVYDLKPMEEVDLAHFFGMKARRGGFNPSLMDSSSAIPPPSNHKGAKTSEISVEGLHGFSQPQFSNFENWLKPSCMEGVCHNSPNPPLVTCTDRVQAAMKDGCTDEDSILKWCAERNLELARTECRRTMRHITST
jgi:hypothetical protein